MPKAVEPEVETFARIKVVGVGGAGGAAINRMVSAGVKGVEFVAVNTDSQALHNSKASTKVHIGKTTTKGLGSGADPAIGQKAAEESKEDIANAVKGADMVFITLGAGGGTGSGAGHLVAKAAEDAGALVVGFATKPFSFEGEKRRRNAEEAVHKLARNVDTLIVVPNDKLLQTIDRRTPLLEAFKVADDVLRQGVQGISDLITVHGLINLDFADVKTVMTGAGSALMGIGRASGENRAVDAAQQAIASPLLEVSIDGARGILFNVVGGPDMAMQEINTIAETITASADPEASIIFGATIDPEMEGEIAVTLVATGFDETYFTARGRVVSPSQAEPADVVVDEATAQELNISDEPVNEAAHHFHADNEAETPNIWELPDTKDEAKKKNEEEDLEKPSFLRRLRRGKKSGSSERSDDEGSSESDDVINR